MLVATLLDLVLPARCGGCGLAGGPLCPACAGAIDGRATAVAPSPVPPGFPPCQAVAGYDGPVRAALIAYKERGRRDLAGVLGGALARSVAAHPAVRATGAVRLVPVPSRAAAVRLRGADTTARLAAAAAPVLRRAGLVVRVDPILRMHRDTADSAGLGICARRANLSGAMVADRPRSGGHPTLVLVDDLVTTGATLAEGARALAAAAHPDAVAAVVAATARWPGVGPPGRPR